MIDKALWADNKNEPYKEFVKTGTNQVGLLQLKIDKEQFQQEAEKLLARDDFPKFSRNTRDYKQAIDEVCSELEMIESLTSVGCSIQTVTVIGSWAYFKTAVKALKFVNAVSKEGYTCEGYGVDEVEHQVYIRFFHEGTIGAQDICARTQRLNKLARASKGKYDGWDVIYSKRTGLIPSSQILEAKKQLRG